MTGPTQPADDLRARIATSLQHSFVGAEMDCRDTEEVSFTVHDTEKAADRLLAAVVEPELARLREERDRARRDYREMGSERDDRQMKVEELRREIDRLRDTHDWLSEACRLTVADAAIVRDQRGRLHRDATTARETLIELIGGDWTVEPSLTALAGYAARFWGDDRKELERLRAVALLSGGNTTPADAAEREDAIRDVLADHGITTKALTEDEAVDLLMDLKDLLPAGALNAPAPSSPAGGGDTATEERELREDEQHHATFRPDLAGGAE